MIIKYIVLIVIYLIVYIVLLNKIHTLKEEKSNYEIKLEKLELKLEVAKIRSRDIIDDQIWNDFISRVIFDPDRRELGYYPRTTIGDILKDQLYPQEIKVLRQILRAYNNAKLKDSCVHNNYIILI